MTTTPNPQSMALELLEIVSKASEHSWRSIYPAKGPSGELGLFFAGTHDALTQQAEAIAALPGLATELRAALDRNTTLRIALADAIRRPIGVVPESAQGLLTAAELDEAEARRPRDGIDVLRERRGKINEAMQSAFTGRQTGRNRADIPTNEGVPLREAEVRERFEQECGGTIYDESGYGSGASINPIS